MTAQRIALSIAAAIAILIAVVFISTIGFWLAVIFILALLTVMARLIPMSLIRFAATAVAIQTLLPKLHLLVFHGGFLAAAVTVVVVTVAAWLTKALLRQTGIMGDIEGQIAREKRTRPAEAFALHVLLLAVIFTVALYAVAYFDANVVLAGLQQTIEAGAVLALINAVCRR